MNELDEMFRKIDDIKKLAEQLVSQQREQAERLQWIEQWIGSVEAPRIGDARTD